MNGASEYWWRRHVVQPRRPNMASLKSNGSSSQGEALKTGYLKKQKTMKKKFFVLKPETAENSARLEYYDDEKKWRKNQQPKRSIVLKTCFNINKHKRHIKDIKHRHVIDLFTKDDCFSIVFDTEEELEEWLRPMLFLQHGEELWDGEPPKPSFEHVWQVEVMERGLGSQSKIRGVYRLCLTDKKLSLVPNGNTKLNTLEFSLMGIRRCGASNNFLYIEVGRSSVTGEGDIYMATTDSVIACNMRDIILQAMSNSKKDELGPKQRLRSCSATESSKPITMNTTTTTSRRQTHIGPYKVTESPGNVYSDRLPPAVQWPALQRTAAQRRHSVSAVGSTGGSHQAPAVSHHQRTHSLPVSPDSNCHVLNENNNYAPMGPPSAATSPIYPAAVNCTNTTSTTAAAAAAAEPDCYITRRGSVGNRLANAKRHNRTGGATNTAPGRERCDSLPSRARTTSEGQMSRTMAHHLRPRSMYAHDGPASPPSNCSTDSAGSSLSIDETDWGDTPVSDCLPPCRYSHSLTPDEHVIFEENDEWERPSVLPKNSPNISSGIHSESPSGASCSSSPLDVNSGYVPMCPGDTGYVDMRLSPAASSCSVTSGTPSTDLRFSAYHLDKVSSFIPVDSNEDSGRPLRTYSVGSKPQHVEQPKSAETTRARAFSVGSHGKGGQRRNLKASSAPAPLVAGSPMGDLMEMDFTSNSASQAAPSGYVEMRPLSQSSSSSTNNSGYVDMRPGSAKDPAPYVDMSGCLSASPNKAAVTPTNYSPYVEMSGNPKLGTSPKSCKSASPKQGEYMLVNAAWRGSTGGDARKPPDGYMEMTCKPQRKQTLSQSSNTSDDYLNMSGKSSAGKRKEHHRRDKNRSKPIAIQPSASNSPPKAGPPPNFLPLQTGNNSSPISNPFASLPRNRTRKTPETPTPTGHVFPFSLTSPGFQAAENPRKCQVDATSGTVRISNQNSNDYAPMSFHRPPAPPVGVAATTCNKTTQHQNCDDYTEIGFEQPRQPVAKDTSEYVNYNPAASSRYVPIARSATADDEFGEYAIVKTTVPSSSRRTAPFRKTSVPIFPTALRETIPKPSASQPTRPQHTSHQVQIVKPGANMTNLPQNSFKPITANLPKPESDIKPKSASPKTVDNLFTRQLSTASDKRHDLFVKSSESLTSKLADGDGGDAVLSRPNSVNSEKISTRPASVNSEKFTMRPSSVSSESSLCRSRPSSSSSDMNSSSSTLVGSRPPSVSSERELHYIQLEHECEAAAGSKSPRGSKCQRAAVGVGTAPTATTSSIAPGTADAAVANSPGVPAPPNAHVEPTFPYTSIDFLATDGMKQNTIPPSTKVKH